MSPSDHVGAPPRSVLIVHPVLPTHDRDSGSRRLRWIVELLLAEGHRVTYLDHAGYGQAEYAQQLRDLGVEVHEGNARWWREERNAQATGPGIDVEGFLRRGRFDLAWLSTYEMGQFYLDDIRRCSPATKILIDTVDVHHVRLQRGAELTGDPADHAKAAAMREAEAAIYSVADRLVAVSAPDGDALRELAPGVPVSIVSNVHAIPEPGPGHADRHGLVFVGSFIHTPNIDAIAGFTTDVWPRVRAALPEATLTIVGTKPPEAVEALGALPGVTVTGWVPETRPHLDAARVSVAPLRWGAGVKGKIGEAMSLGVPVVTTTVGAEGMDLADGETALIADADDAMAAAIVRAHEDAELWEALSANGRAHVDRTLGLGAARTALGEIFTTLLTRPFVVADPWSAPAVLPAALAGYLSAFTSDDPVSLVLPVGPATPGGADAAVARVLEALAAQGADPEAIADVAIVPAASAHVPVPLGGVRVGAATAPEEPTTALALDASAEAWRAAVAPGAPAPTWPDSAPLVSVVICLHGKHDYTERCLASLDDALGHKLGREVELVLVDNASPDDTRALLAAWEDRARIVLLDENRNFAGGNNAGAAVARGRVLLFLNNDTEVPAGAVEALAEEALSPSVGAVGARLLYPDGRIQHGGFGWRGTGGEVPGSTPFHMFHGEAGDLPVASLAFDTSSVTGACIAVRADLFEAVGRFDEAYINGWEDADLCQRLRDTGARIRYRGDVAVVHHEGVTSGGAYGRAGNEARFRATWHTTLDHDGKLTQTQLGAPLRTLLPGLVSGGVAADGAQAVVVGPVRGIGPDADEARGLLAGLRAVGAGLVARTPAPTWLGPDLDDEHRTAVEDAHLAPARPGAATIAVRDASFATPDAPIGGGVADPAVVSAATNPTILRLADVPDAVVAGAQAWAATPAVATALVAAGWPATAVHVVPPLGIAAPYGRGGAGTLALLAEHDAAHADAVLGALVAAGDAVPGPQLVVVPTVRTPELGARVAAVLPGAELALPLADDRRLGETAAAADVVLALDPRDLFDRRALSAAAAGAAVVVRPDGPAAALLGELAVTADPYDAQAIAAALARVDTSAEARTARAEAVAAACGPDAARAALRTLPGHAPADEHRAAIDLFSCGDVRGAIAALERALAAGFDAEVANDLAVVLHSDGDVTRAHALLTEILAVAPDHAGARENLEALSAPPAFAAQRAA